MTKYCTRFLNGLFFLTGLILLPHIALASPPLWLVDMEKSQLTFDVKRDGQQLQGKFAAFEPVITFDKNNLAASKIKVTIQTNSATTGQQASDAALPSKDWLNVGTFPTATFESHSITAKAALSDGTENYEATGKLTILGVSQDVVLPFTLKPQDANTHAQGFLVIKRLDFGVGKQVDPQEKLVTNDVAIRFDLLAKPAKTE